jgi:signal transduction histidine kinase
MDGISKRDERSALKELRRILKDMRVTTLEDYDLVSINDFVVWLTLKFCDKDNIIRRLEKKNE